MNTSLNIPSLFTSPVVPRKGSSGNVSSLDDNAFGTYFPYDVKSEWANFPCAPQLSTEDAEYLGHQTLDNDSLPSYERGHAAWVPEDQKNPSFDHGTNLQASSEAPVQTGTGVFFKSTTQKNFVRKLYEMLEDESAQTYIYWNQDGKSFVIDSPDNFAKNVLGRYLKTGNFQSFIRQLNMYDFHKTNKALRAQRGVKGQTQQFVFSHPKFQKDKPELLSEIKRKGTEQQDPPPYHETLSSAVKVVSSHPQSHPPLEFSQLDHRSEILLQEENERLRQENEQLKAAYEELISEHDLLKASPRVGTSMPGPQAQNESSSSALTTHPSFLDGNPSGQSCDLTGNGNLYEFNYTSSPPKPVEKPSLFPQYTRAMAQSISNYQSPLIVAPSLLSLSSTSLPSPSTNAPSPNISKTRRSSPQYSQRKEWRTSWGEWLYDHLPLVGNQDEAGPSSRVNVLPRDAHATHNSNYGKAPLGFSRAQPVMRVARHQT